MPDPRARLAALLKIRPEELPLTLSPAQLGRLKADRRSRLKARIKERARRRAHRHVKARREAKRKSRRRNR